MTDSLKRVLLTGYFLTLTVGLLYYLFPSEAAIRFVKAHAERLLPELDLTIEDIKPTFPPGMTIKGLTFSAGEAPMAGIPKVTISPTLGSVFRKEKVFRLKAAAAGGSMRGYIRAPGEGGPGADLDLTRIALSQIPALKTLTGLDIDGRLEGKITQKKDDPAAPTAISLVITDGKATFESPVFGMEAADFTRIESEIEWSSERILIKKCDGTGPQADVALTGEIRLLSPLSESSLDLEVRVKPRPVFMAALNRQIPPGLLPGSATGQEGIPFRIRGTFDRPVPAFN